MSNLYVDERGPMCRFGWSSRGHQQRGCSFKADGGLIGRSSFQGFPTPRSQLREQLVTAQEELSGNVLGGATKKGGHWAKYDDEARRLDVEELA